jgi:DNA polymerase I
MVDKNPKSLYIIDGHALAYRSYFAFIKNPLTNSQGVPTSAVFGFANYLFYLIEKFKCPYIVVAMDSPTPTFRHKLFAQYKAQRPEMPADLRTQFPLIHRLIDAFNIVKIQKDGFEADDIIAYLTQTAVAEDFEVSLVTKDKDLMQLVGPHVRMLAPDIGNELKVFGPKEVQEKMGVSPEQIRDLLALMGDSSDNIPGVPGVGPKTAQKILEQAGSIDKLIENPSCIDNVKLRQKIIENIETLKLSKTLATLTTDLNFTIDIETLKSKPVLAEESLSLFKELDFHSFAKNPIFANKDKIENSVQVLQTIEQVKDLAASITRNGFVSVDTETTSTLPRKARLVGISMAIEKNQAFYLPVGHEADTPQFHNLSIQETLAALKEVIESPHIAKIGQNLKYDYQIFKNYGIHLAGITFDTMVAAYIIDPGTRRYSLDILARQWLNKDSIPIEALIGKGKDQKSFASVPIESAAEYSGEDAVLPLYLKELFDPIIAQRNQISLLNDIEIPLVSVLAEMEWQGAMLDVSLLKGLSVEYSEKLRHLSQNIYDLAGEEFNLNSPKQISEILFVKLGLPRSKKIKTGLSTDVDALEKLEQKHPIVPKLLEYRETQKLLSTYIDAFPQLILPETQRLHSSFNQTVTATGRLSSTAPNLQNIPVRTEPGRKIREAFSAPPGFLVVSADYSQIELRLLAHMSKDEFLIRAFLDDQDIHRQTASAIFGVFPEMVTTEMRRSAKTINFGLLYGMGPINLARQLTISFKEAQEFIDAYFRQFPSIGTFMKESIEKARRLGYSETMLGRRRYVPDIRSENRQVREAAERIALNTPVQGSAADIIKVAMAQIHEALPKEFPGARMLIQVHDELVFETPEKEIEDFKNWTRLMMGNAGKLDVPLKVDVGSGKNWSEAH